MNMAHSIVVPEAQSLEELGVKVAHLRYDAQLVFFQAYMEELHEQSLGDLRRGREKLWETERSFASFLALAYSDLEEMLKISAPYMKEEINAQPLPVPTPPK